MHSFTAVVEKCPETGLFVGFIPGFPGAHTQGESLDELQANLREVVSMLLEDGEPSWKQSLWARRLWRSEISNGPHPRSQARRGNAHPAESRF